MMRWRAGLGKRLAPWIFVAGIAVVLAAHPRWIAPVAVRLAGAAAHAAALGAPPADAGTLRFHTVPPESEAAVERRMGRTPRTEPDSISEEEPSSPPVPPSPPGPTRTGDVMRVGSDIHIGAGELVKGDVTAVKGDVVVDGHVEGNVVSMFGDVYLNSSARVDGDVVCMRGELHEQPGAQVSGQRVTALGGERGARRWERVHRYPHPAGGAAWAIVVWIVFVGLAWGAALLTPGRLGASLGTLQRQPMLSFGLTMLVVALAVPSLVALCIVVALLCITVIGIPLALAALFAYGLFYAAMAAWGWATGAALIGRWLAARRGASLATGTAGPVVPGVPDPGAAAVADVRRWVLFGAIAIMTWILVGAVLSSAGEGSALGGFGVLIIVLGWITFGILCWFGAGAWLRSEFTTGLIGRWWSGRRRATPVVPPAMPPSGGPPPVPPAPPEPPPPPPQPPADPASPSPPETYRPPGLESPH